MLVYMGIYLYYSWKKKTPSLLLICFRGSKLKSYKTRDWKQSPRENSRKDKAKTLSNKILSSKITYRTHLTYRFTED